MNKQRAVERRLERMTKKKKSGEIEQRASRCWAAGVKSRWPRVQLGVGSKAKVDYHVDRGVGLGANKSAKFSLSALVLDRISTTLDIFDPTASCSRKAAVQLLIGQPHASYIFMGAVRRGVGVVDTFLSTNVIETESY